jgi:hypothetical protein
MANKRTKRVSFARISVHQMSAENYDWGRLEAAYGHEFSIDARQRIVDATQSYFMLAGFELSAEPLSAAIQSVRSLQKSAKQFHKSILREHNNPNRWSSFIFLTLRDARTRIQEEREGIQQFGRDIVDTGRQCIETICGFGLSALMSRIVCEGLELHPEDSSVFDYISHANFLREGGSGASVEIDDGRATAAPR